LVEAFVNSADISQVEDVVELQRSSWKLFEAEEVELKSSLSDLVDTVGEVFWELLQVLGQKAGEDLLDGFL